MKLLLFGRLGDLCEETEQSLTLPEDVGSVRSLRAWLDRKLNGEGVFLEPTVHVCVNQQIVFDDAIVSDRDEIAFLPPVGGG